MHSGVRGSWNLDGSTTGSGKAGSSASSGLGGVDDVVAFVTFPQDGLQNGSPDGMALFDNTGALVEFRSYEGTFTASNGPAVSVVSVDIGASETNAPLGLSLQRNSSGVWGPTSTRWPPPSGCEARPSSAA